MKKEKTTQAVETTARSHFGTGYCKLLFCRGEEKEKECRWCKNYRYELEGCCYVFCLTLWMQRNTTSHLINKYGKGFSVGIGWLGSKSIHQKYFPDILGGNVQCLVSSV
jgi:hypothetical protein